MNAAGSSDDDLVCLGEINQEEVKKSANRQYGSSQPGVDKINIIGEIFFGKPA